MQIAAFLIELSSFPLHERRAELQQFVNPFLSLFSSSWSLINCCDQAPALKVFMHKVLQRSINSALQSNIQLNRITAESQAVK